MKRAAREFLEQEESVAAARSKQRKKDERKRRDERFRLWLIEKAERIEMSGNLAAAKTFRDFWSRTGSRWTGGVRFPGHTPPAKRKEGR